MTEKRATPVDKGKGQAEFIAVRLLFINFQGINNPMVSTFIEQIVQNTDFKFGMYLDGDCIGFKKQEMI